MRLTRGQFIGATAAGVAGVSLTGCTEVTRRLSPLSWPERVGTVEAGPGDPAWRVLNRMAYGPRPGDVERVREMGVEGWIEEQLAPERIEEERAAWVRLLPMDTLDMAASEAKDFETATYPEVGKGQAAIELQQACVLRAVYSRRQLEQVMVEFWSDHFNISQLKGECSWLKTVDDREVRKHSMGRFRDLISASARSAAMLFYLDNDQNVRKDMKTRKGINENYARELLELHTLGVNGGYTLGDIQEVARCFTGWSYKQGNELWNGEFTFRKERHDDGPKRVLGTLIPAGQGVKDGEQVIDLVCRHPSTARFVARKLCRRFVADQGPEPLVGRLAEVFRKTDGDIRQVLSELFHSEEFLRGRERKLKRPFDFVVSALRAVNADTSGAHVLPYLEKMGQLPYKWAMPDGYPDRVDAWTPSLLARWNFALDLAQGRIKETGVQPERLAGLTGEAEPLARCRALSRALLGRSLPEARLKAMAALGAGEVRQWLALLLASPEFQWR